jgi:hypothetical protein
MKAEFFVFVPVRAVLVHDISFILGAVRMIRQCDDCREERLLRRPPSAGQRIAEDDPFSLDDVEEAGI